MKKNIQIAVFIIIGLICSVNIFAQENNTTSVATVSLPYYPYSIEASGQLTYPVGNYALDSNFGGVFLAHLSVQTKIFKRLYGGVEAEVNQISEITSVPFPIATSVTRIFFYNGGLKLSYYSSELSQWFFSGTIAGGPSLVYFSVPGVSGIPTKRNTYFVSPSISESLKVNDELRIGLEINILYEGYAFNTADVALPFTDPAPETKANSIFFGWGFNVLYFMGKAKH